MQQLDDFSAYHDDLLEGRYDCVDRIVINGYFPLGQQGGGFRSWWRKLTGSDETLDQAHLQRLAGRFSRRIHAWANKQTIPLIHCAAGERKHELAERYLPQDPDFHGLFLILVAKAPGLVWEVKHSANGVPHLQRKTPWPYVNHYHFHFIDPEWGHITIKMSGHPPFGIQVMLNGHEWVERQARRQTISASKEGNCFVGGSFQALDRPAYNLTVFKVHFGPLTLKLYDKGARVLRIEAIAHNVKGLRCGKSVEKLPIMLAKLQRMVIDFLNVIQAAHHSFLPDGILDTLRAPTQRGERRLAGVDLQTPRMQAVSEALLALAPKPGGFSLAELAAKVRELLPDSTLSYAPRHASYDLSKLRGKELVERIQRSRRYRIRQQGIRVLAGMLILREKVIKPVLAGIGKHRLGRPPKNICPLDQHYINLQQKMRRTFETLALVA